MSTHDLCSAIVGAGAMGWRCRLSDGHDGPHEAPEYPPSIVARKQWEAERDGKIEKVRDPSPVDLRPVEVGMFRSQADRLAAVNATLTVEYAALPVAIQTWINGASAQMALIELYQAWCRSADGSLTLDRAAIEAIVPPKLQIEPKE